MGTLNLALLGSPNCHRSLVQSVKGAQLFPWPFYKQLVHRNLLNTSFFSPFCHMASSYLSSTILFTFKEQGIPEASSPLRVIIMNIHS